MQTGSERRNVLALAGWIALTFTAAATGVFVSTGGWYAGLVKPSWNPPGWLFGPVWTLLYAMMAVAAWLVWQRGGWAGQRRSLGLYVTQWVLNALWTPLFFGLHRPGLALADLAVLWAALAATAAGFWRVRAAAGWLLAPYLAWATFAAALNFAVWRLNP